MFCKGISLNLLKILSCKSKNTNFHFYKFCYFQDDTRMKVIEANKSIEFY